MRLSFKMEVSDLMREHTGQPPMSRPQVPTAAGPAPTTPGSAGPSTPLAQAQRSGSGSVAGSGRQASWGEAGQQEGPVLSTRLQSWDLQGRFAPG